MLLEMFPSLFQSIQICQSTNSLVEINGWKRFISMNENIFSDVFLHFFRNTIRMWNEGKSNIWCLSLTRSHSLCMHVLVRNFVPTFLFPPLNSSRPSLTDKENLLIVIFHYTSDSTTPKVCDRIRIHRGWSTNDDEDDDVGAGWERGIRLSLHSKAGIRKWQNTLAHTHEEKRSKHPCRRLNDDGRWWQNNHVMMKMIRRRRSRELRGFELLELSYSGWWWRRELQQRTWASTELQQRQNSMIIQSCWGTKSLQQLQTPLDLIWTRKI